MTIRSHTRWHPGKHKKPRVPRKIKPKLVAKPLEGHELIAPEYSDWVNTTYRLEGSKFILECDLDLRFGMTQGTKRRVAQGLPPKPSTLVARLPSNHRLFQDREARIHFTIYEPGPFPQHVALELFDMLANCKEAPAHIRALAGYLTHCLEGRPGPLARFIQEIKRGLF